MIVAENRKAHYNYFILDTYQAGIVLVGSEIKSVRAHKVSFNDAYVSIKHGEVFLKDMHIAEYKEANRFNHDEKRVRKLLLHKSEIAKLENKIKLEGYTIIPLKMSIEHGLAKVTIGLAKGKNMADKRHTSKQREMDRAAQAAMKRG